MAVTRDDVRRLAALARIGVDESRLDALVRDLDGILAHMDALKEVPDAAATRPERGIALAPDVVGAEGLSRPIDAFAPAARDGFFLVPRLGTHDAAAAPEDGA